MREIATEYPRSICLETYSLCNGECSFCPYKRLSKGTTPTLLDIETIHRIIDEVSTYEIKRFTLFNNNEPLLDDRIQDIIVYTRNKLPNVRLTLSSNGKILTKELIEQTIKNGIDRLFVSIPTLDHIAYESIMGTQLEGIIDVLMSLSDEIAKKIRIAVPKTNYYSYEDYNELFGKKGIKWIVWEMEACKDWDEFETIKKISPLQYEIGCDRPLDQAIISSNGDVLICCRDWEHENRVGNIYQNSLKDIWQGEKMINLQKYICNKEFDKIQMCCKCSRVNNLERSS